MPRKRETPLPPRIVSRQGLGRGHRRSRAEIEADEQVATLAEAKAREAADASASPVRAVLKKAVQSEHHAKQARASFKAFIQYMWEDFELAPHIELIITALEQIVFNYELGASGTSLMEKDKNLMVELPPRHGKSTLVAQYLPAWFLGRNPNCEVIIATYGASLSEEHSYAVRELIKNRNFQDVFPGIQLAPDFKSRDSWRLSFPHSGKVNAMGIGGAVTGKGGQLIITDDLIKDPETAESETERSKVWEWFTSALLTRKNYSAVQVAIGTRWHEDDPHGKIHRDFDDNWTFITLPALAEENDPLGRQVGEALWPARFPADFLHNKHRELKDYGFYALYQQTPQPREGGVIKAGKITLIDFDLVKSKRFDRIVRFWDLAMSENARADYTACIKLAVLGGFYYILDVIRVQLDWAKVVPFIERVTLQDGRGVHVGIERAGYMSRAVKELLKRSSLRGYVIRGYTAEHDKLQRINPFSVRIEEGLVHMVRAAWNDSYIQELAAFPSGKHDDQVDATSGADRMLATRPIESRRTRSL